MIGNAEVPAAFDAILRLLAAVVAGAAIGVNRDLHGKPAGLRTHGLVALGAAAITLATMRLVALRDPGAVAHTIQGIITGCGFIGAGVILHPAHRRTIQGLTTAASIWMVACLGATLGAGEWLVAGASAVLTLLVLVFGGPIEQSVRARFGGREPGGHGDDPAALRRS